jgi:hypothetical protein
MKVAWSAMSVAKENRESSLEWAGFWLRNPVGTPLGVPQLTRQLLGKIAQSNLNSNNLSYRLDIR